jgi:hypothetical protein
MLPDRFRQLLTTYVDGEATPRQRQEIENLVQRSGEARELLRQLQGDAACLRALPRPGLGPDFTGQVLQAIADRRLQPGRQPALAKGRTLPAWLGVAVAASVFVAVTVASFVYFSPTSVPPDQLQTALLTSAPSTANSDRPALATRTLPVTVPLSNSEPLAPAPAAPLAPTVVKEDGTAPPTGPAMNEKSIGAAEDTELAAPSRNLRALEVVTPKLALTLTLGELQRVESRERLRKELHGASGCRLELFCRGIPGTLDRVAAALETQGVGLLVDASVQVRRRSRVRGDYLLYADSFTADDCLAVFRRLGMEDGRDEANERGSGRFASLMVLPLLAADRQELSACLGVSPAQLDAPPAKKTDGVNIRRPIAEATAGEVIRSLEGQGEMPRPEAGKSIANLPLRGMVLVPYQPLHPRAVPSREVKQFLELRSGRGPGTIAVILILRGAA